MPLPPKEARTYRRVLNKLKLPKKTKDLLFDIKEEVHDAYAEQINVLQNTVKMWERLYLDRPEDRLWHAKDRTWWKRLHGKELKAHLDLEKNYLEKRFGTKDMKVHHDEFSLYRASPPPEIHDVIYKAHIVLNTFLKKAGKRQPKELVEAIRQLSKSLKPFYEVQYMTPYSKAGKF